LGADVDAGGINTRKNKGDPVDKPMNMCYLCLALMIFNKLKNTPSGIRARVSNW
jgi:hypothetical protein